MSTAIRRALYGRMSADVTLNGLLATPAAGFAKAIYHQQAPDKAAFPFVIFSKSSGVPTEAMSDPSAFDTDVWLVKGVDRNTTADGAEAIAIRLNALLNDGALSISGGTLLYLRRQSDVEYAEVIDGVQVKHAGALYRLIYE